jgi:hypothetical protein
MKKFEYDIWVNLNIVQLNDYGSKGWELVVVTVEIIDETEIPQPVFYFKREIK